MSQDEEILHHIKELTGAVDALITALGWQTDKLIAALLLNQYSSCEEAKTEYMTMLKELVNFEEDNETPIRRALKRKAGCP